MKKLVSAGLVAFCVIAIAQQNASAWTNSKFGVGLNWERQAGGNSALWGAWRNGQPPGPEAFGGGYSCPQGMPYGAPRAHPQQAFFPPQPTALPQGLPANPQPALAPSGFMDPAAFGPQGNLNGQRDPSLASRRTNPHQIANYPRQVYYYNMPYYGR